MMDYCKYVDVFYGNGEVDHYARMGLASKWFYIKALCGNTLPHAILPFGRMSVGAYSGGYPTGYGTHYPNSCGGIRKLWDKMKIRGFSHLHQFGTGAIQYYYNYAVVTPFYGEIADAFTFRGIENEQAKPGFYGVDLQDVQCRLTTTADTAYHAYHFQKENGRLLVDFSNDGLSRVFDERYHATVQNPKMQILSGDTVICEGTYSGIRLYFCVRVKGENVRCALFEGEQFGAVFDFDGSDAEVLVSCSAASQAQANEFVDATTDDFDTTAKKAYDAWNAALSRIRIEGSDIIRRKFYTNLYHSLTKPSDRAGENIPVSDIGTFWDQYKTLFPLLYTCYDDMGKKLADTIVKISREKGKVLCSVGLSTIQPCEEQAKMLGMITLCDACYAGLVTKEEIDECTKRELARPDFRTFIEDGVFERYTHILDTVDACHDVAQLTEDEDFRALLMQYADRMGNAYAEDGILSEKSPYYEGDRYTYSFRLHADMDKRIALAGGKERFVQLLDDFFGFGKESVEPVLDMEEAYKKIAETHYHRFQGYNNEPDMETPYSYIFAGRHDRTCAIIKEGTEVSFAEGKGGLPGNNDSGGLSSCFVWNVLGLFPMAGTGKFLIGFPQVDAAELSLKDGRKLRIEVSGTGDTVRRVTFNGVQIEDFILPADKVYAGGTLVIER